MKIVHVVQSLALGGQEILIARLAESLRARGHRSIVVPLVPGGALEARFPPGDVLPLARRDGRDPLLVARLARLLFAERPDVVHTHNDSPLVYGTAAAWLARVPCIVHTKHGAKAPPRNHGVRKVLSRALRAYVAVSAETAERAVRDLGIDPRRVVTIPNGIPTAAFAPSAEARRAIRRELGLDENAFVVGTLGRIVPEKNPLLLLSAMRPLLARGAHLLFVGDGPERAGLEAAIARDSVPNVRLLGARDDTARILCALDVFALSSHIEGLPLALVEAMATERPVVSTDVGGIAEATADTAVLVPPGDEAALRAALEGLWASPDRRATLGRAAGVRAREAFDFERVVEDYLRLYASPGA